MSILKGLFGGGQVPLDAAIAAFSLRSVQDVKDFLSTQVDGTLATLRGPTDIVCTFRRHGAGDYRAHGEIKLFNADGSEFTIGTNGSGSDIERFGAADAPTWGTPGPSTGGLLFNGSGGVAFPCFGERGYDMLMVGAKVIPTLTSVSGNPGFAVGTIFNSRALALGGGAYYNAGWNRRYLIMSTAPTVTYGGTAPADAIALATDDNVSCCLCLMATNKATNHGNYMAGCYRGDEGPAQNDQIDGSSSSAGSGYTDHEVFFHVTAGAGDVSARLRNLYIEDTVF